MSLTILEQKTVRARKQHRCSWCNRKRILPGDSYERTSMIFDGDFICFKGCNRCEGVVRAAVEDSEAFRDDYYGCREGLAPDDLWDWLHERTRWRAEKRREGADA